MKTDLRSKILKYDRLVPRYTSYPTAPHFQAIGDEQTYRAHLTGLPDQSRLSLYVHIPFCAKMCWYCGCHTKITERYAPVEDYAHLLLREIDMLGEVLSPTHLVENIHFGGGSPGMLRSCDFISIMNKIRTTMRVSPSAEIAIEIDPRGVSQSRVAAYAEAGVTRVSLGVQDFNDKVMEAVNRPQPFSLSQEAVTLFRSYGINQFNFDLLYGLPHQTVGNMKETIKKTLSLDPDRISLFGYAHVPWMKKHMRLIDETSLPDQRERYDLFDTGASALKQAGYIPIGIDHFAKETDSMTKAMQTGTLRRNFQGYTTDTTDALIGIGASSIGKLPTGYIQNAVAMNHYRDAILGGHFPAQKICTLSNEDSLHAEIIERLMCNFEVDIGEVCLRYNFPVDYLDARLFELEEFMQDELVTLHHERTIRISAEARHIARVICSIFDDYLVKAADTPRHAKAV